MVFRILRPRWYGRLSALGTAGWQLPLPEATFQVDLADRPHGRYPNLQRIAHETVVRLPSPASGPASPRRAPRSPPGFRDPR